jgi:hypothetical protein
MSMRDVGAVLKAVWSFLKIVVATSTVLYMAWVFYLVFEHWRAS